jgi:hypothetical protein
MSYVVTGNGACKSLLNFRRARLAHRRAIRQLLPAVGQPDQRSLTTVSAMADEARVFCKDQSARTQFEAALANQVLGLEQHSKKTGCGTLARQLCQHHRSSECAQGGSVGGLTLSWQPSQDTSHAAKADPSLHLSPFNGSLFMSHLGPTSRMGRVLLSAQQLSSTQVLVCPDSLLDCHCSAWEASFGMHEILVGSFLCIPRTSYEPTLQSWVRGQSSWRIGRPVARVGAGKDPPVFKPRCCSPDYLLRHHLNMLCMVLCNPGSWWLHPTAAGQAGCSVCC